MSENEPNFPKLPEGIASAAFTNLPLSMVITDPRQADNPVVYVNRAFVKMTGFAPEAVLGRNCRFLQADIGYQPGLEELRHAIDAETEITVDLMNYRANGEKFVNRLMISPILNERGETIFFLGLQTERPGALSHAERVQDLDQQLREVQHRVKNHLGMILSMIRIQGRTDGSKEETISVLTRRVEALSLLYEQVLNPKAQQDDQRVALGAYVSRIIASLQLLSDRASVRVDTHTEEGEISFGQASRLGLLVSEVFTNALQHAFEGDQRGEIVVDLTLGDTDVCLAVTDNGKGLGDIDWPNDGSLGSRIVRDLVSRLSGKLEVGAGADGRGTSVEIIFPRD